MEKREKFEIPTIAFTEVTMLTTASSTCAPSDSNTRPGNGVDQGVLVDQNCPNNCPTNISV